MTDTTLSQAILDDILANPADDTPRLVYADLLEEQGDSAHAEFIRCQIRLARCAAEKTSLLNEETDWAACSSISASWCPVCGDCVCPYPEDEQCDPKCPLHNRASRHCCLEELTLEIERLREREAELLSIGSQAKGFNDIFPGYVGAWRFRRGFVAEIEMACEPFVEHAGALFSAHPIERVTITDKKVLSDDADTEWMWGWFKNYDQQGWTLPRPLFDQLLPDVNCTRVADYDLRANRTYATEAGSLASLREACLRLGRERAKEG